MMSQIMWKSQFVVPISLFDWYPEERALYITREKMTEAAEKYRISKRYMVLAFKIKGERKSHVFRYDDSSSKLTYRAVKTDIVVRIV